MMQQTYELFGLEYSLELSTRPENAMGDEAMWARTEAALREVLDRTGQDYRINEGDGAFYGPKIDIHLHDCIGRRWQCATVQLDNNLPARFSLKYTAPDDSDRTPIVIHRAIAGSLERFFAILVEHFAGAFPTWLAPVQARVLTITDEQAPYAHEVGGLLRQAGIRAEVDDRGEKIGYKVREAELQKVPYMLTVGGREAEQREVDVRMYTGGRRGAMDVEELRDEILRKIASRELDVEVERFAVVESSEDEEVGQEMAERGY